MSIDPQKSSVGVTKTISSKTISEINKKLFQTTTSSEKREILFEKKKIQRRKRVEEKLLEKGINLEEVILNYFF